MRATTAAVLFVLASCAGETALRPDVMKSDGWTTTNAEAKRAVEDDRRVLRLAPVGGNRAGSNVAMALVTNVTFGEGAIDVDLRGSRDAGASFLGVVFGAAGPDRYEAVYFRPFRFRATDEIERSHAVQYIAWPEHTWEALRKASPGVYEHAIAPVPDPAGWFHARIEVGKTTVKVYVDGAAQPTLTVQRLRSERGGVGLWVDSQEGAFANLTIQPAA